MRYDNFFKYFGIGFAFVIGTTFTINYLFDPLWYFGGNKIQSHNYAFDERLSKLNLLKEGEYNCLIFGSSRATFLDASKLSNANCFNMAFSGGTIHEFIDFAKLIKSSFDFKIDYLIVGVDVINFFNGTKPKKWKKAELPPTFLLTYLSIDSLMFSIKLFLEKTPLPRIYNSDFEITVINKLPKFNPNGSLIQPIKGILNESIVDKYVELNNIFNPVKSIYYVPPLSAWHIRDAYQNELLEDYVSAIYLFKENDLNIIDYSSISETTLEPSNTYDGHHYLPRISSLIANDLNKMLINIEPLEGKFGLQVNNYSYERYLEEYFLKVKQNFDK